MVTPNIALNAWWSSRHLVRMEPESLFLYELRLWRVQDLGFMLYSDTICVSGGCSFNLCREFVTQSCTLNFLEYLRSLKMLPRPCINALVRVFHSVLL